MVEGFSNIEGDDSDQFSDKLIRMLIFASYCDSFKVHFVHFSHIELCAVTHYCTLRTLPSCVTAV